MKRVLCILFWIISILAVATVLSSLGYTFSESIFIGTLFLPGALAVKYFFPKISFRDRKSGIMGVIFVTTAIIILEILLFVLAHLTISIYRDNGYYYLMESSPLPDLLNNPVFISIMIAVLAIANYYYEKMLDRKIVEKPKPITFLSERKAVSLDVNDILFIEYNDDVTIVVASEDRRFRNRTPISQWENILGGDFARIHRSFLVNRNAITKIDPESVFVGEIELPISRKYKDCIKNLL